MERLGECIRAWMEEKSISVSELCKELEYKSKTTVYRILRGESDYESCRRLSVKLSPLMDPAWAERVQQAMLVEKVGLSRYSQFQQICACLFGMNEDRKEPGFTLPPKLSGGTLILLGCPWDAAFSMIRALLEQDGSISVMHYITAVEIENNAMLLSGLIESIQSFMYQALLVEKEKLQLLQLPWNVGLYIPQESETIWWLLCSGTSGIWQCQENGKEMVRSIMDSLAALKPSELYRYDQLDSSIDYIRFTKDAYQMERNRQVVAVKPTPGMQMLPAQVVENTFRDFLADNPEPVSAAQETLIYNFEKRVQNFYHRKAGTWLCFSQEAMMKFAQTGSLTDQFFAFRPFTPQERRKCLSALADFSRGPEVRFILMPGPIWPVSFEAYGGAGVLLYPSNTSYNSHYDAYRELFLPGAMFSDLFTQYAEECLFNKTSDTSIQIERMITAIHAAE